jgi:chromosomal replication initiation ATPase DnaA
MTNRNPYSASFCSETFGRYKLNQIKKTICEVMDLKENVMIARCNKYELVVSRQIYCKLAREILNLTLSEIGKEINRDHATVLHSIKEIDSRLQFDSPSPFLYGKSVKSVYEKCFNRLIN